MCDFEKILKNIVDKLPEEFFLSAKTLQTGVLKELKALGYPVLDEYPAPDRGDGSPGRIDIVVTNPLVAIELDRSSPRKKSIKKLLQFNGQRFIILRSNKEILKLF